VLRLQRALALHDRGRDMAGVAAVTGFYDQAHLLRCYREMVGCTPGRFRAERAAALPAPLDRVPGRVTSTVVVPPSRHLTPR
jgi:AraC-like DNA-binding protein